MTERRTIATISIITDCDTEMYRMGEVDGGFDERELHLYLMNHGETGYYALLEKLAQMQSHVLKTWHLGRAAQKPVGAASG